MSIIMHDDDDGLFMCTLQDTTAAFLKNWFWNERKEKTQEKIHRTKTGENIPLWHQLELTDMWRGPEDQSSNKTAYCYERRIGNVWIIGLRTGHSWTFDAISWIHTSVNQLLLPSSLKTSIHKINFRWVFIRKRFTFIPSVRCTLHRVVMCCWLFQWVFGKEEEEKKTLEKWISLAFLELLSTQAKMASGL